MLFSFLDLHVELIWSVNSMRTILNFLDCAEWPADLLQEISHPKPLLFFCTGPATFSQPKQQCFCYFIHKGSIYNFIWKQTPPLIFFFCFENHCVIVGNTGDKGPFGRSSRLLTRETAGRACRNPWDLFPCRGSWSTTCSVPQPAHWASPATTCSLNCPNLKICLHSAV